MTAYYEQIRPIETDYNGVHFRSRLEARWAVLFDALSVPWKYEPEKFKWGATTYIPDFRIELSNWIGNDEIWVEIKPVLDFVQHEKVMTLWNNLKDRPYIRKIVVGTRDFRMYLPYLGVIDEVVFMITRKGARGIERNKKTHGTAIDISAAVEMARGYDFTEQGASE